MLVMPVTVGRSAGQRAGEAEGLIRAGQGGHPGGGGDVALRQARSVTLTWGRLPPSAHGAVRRVGVECPGRAVVGRHVHARVGGDVQDRVISRREVVDYWGSSSSSWPRSS